MYIYHQWDNLNINLIKKRVIISTYLIRDSRPILLCGFPVIVLVHLIHEFGFFRHS